MLALRTQPTARAAPNRGVVRTVRPAKDLPDAQEFVFRKLYEPRQRVRVGTVRIKRGAASRLRLRVKWGEHRAMPQEVFRRQQRRTVGAVVQGAHATKVAESDYLEKQRLALPPAGESCEPLGNAAPCDAQRKEQHRRVGAAFPCSRVRVQRKGPEGGVLISSERGV